MSKMPVLVAPSILSANFADLTAALSDIEKSSADWVHLDVMDGHFVPNLTFGPKLISDLRPLTKLPFDVHLMITNPEEMADAYIDAGADLLVFHIEAIVHSHRLLQKIKSRGVKAGISIVPSTPVSACTELLSEIDEILVMTVNPGFGGQSMIHSCVQKIRQLAEYRRENNLNFLINVDGGVNEETYAMLVDAGADVLVSGSSFFQAKNKSAYVASLKGEKIV